MKQQKKQFMATKKAAQETQDKICSWKPTKQNKQTNTQFKYSIVSVNKIRLMITNGKFYIGMKEERVQVSRTSSLST
jgi:hypothetical protein